MNDKLMVTPDHYFLKLRNSDKSRDDCHFRSLCRTRLRPIIGLKVVYFMMFISLIALVVKISVLDRKFSRRLIKLSSRLVSEGVTGGAGGARAPPIFGAFITMRGLKRRFSPTNNGAQVGRAPPI